MKKKKLIVTVCRGNISRSPIAAALISQEVEKRGLSEKFKVISRGVQGTKVDPKKVQFPNISFYKEIFKHVEPILKELEIDLSKNVSTPIDLEIVNKANILIAMDEDILKKLKILFPNSENKMILLSELTGKTESITDPEGKDNKETQQLIIDQIKKYVDEGIDNLIKKL